MPPRCPARHPRWLPCRLDQKSGKSRMRVVKLSLLPTLQTDVDSSPSPLPKLTPFERDYLSIRKQITAGVHALVPAPPGRAKAFLKTHRLKLVTEPAGFVKRSAER